MARRRGWICRSRWRGFGGITTLRRGSRFVRWIRWSGRSRCIDGEDANRLNSAAIAEDEIVLGQIRDGAVLVMHHHVHLNEARGSTNYRILVKPLRGNEDRQQHDREKCATPADGPEWHLSQLCQLPARSSA